MTLRRLLSCALGLALLSSLIAAPAGPLPPTTPEAAGFSSARLETFHRSLDRVVDAGEYAGYVVLIARDGKLVDLHAHGWQDAVAKVPMRPDSIVRIFSMSKIVTSVAVLMLLEEGRLRLTDPVEKYLPALKDRKVFVGGTADAPQLEPASRPITIRDLLTHTAGYYYDAAWSADPVPMELMTRAKLWDATTTDDFVARIAPLPLNQQPGTKFRYGIHTDLLGAIVEKISGERLDAFFQKRIFGPLGMRDTGFWVPAEKQDRLARIHQRNAAGKLELASFYITRDDPTPTSGFCSGGGGLYSTAADYARFAQMLLNGGALDGTRLLGRKTVELMRQDHLTGLADPHPFGTKSLGFGLGVRITTNPGASPVLGSAGTFGWDGAATTLVQMDPQERTVAILLTQHLPYNQDDIFALFINGYFSAIID
jgi:CubicO group peptidase (beta-lactamase class C family)